MIHAREGSDVVLSSGEEEEEEEEDKKAVETWTIGRRWKKTAV